MTETTNYKLKKPAESEYYDVTGTFNVNADITDAELKKAGDHRAAANPHSGSEGLLKNAAAKEAPVDADAIVITDSAASGGTKRVLWSKAKAALATALGESYAAKSHAASHASGGSDAVTPAAIGAEAQIKNAAAKGAPADADAVPLIDSEAQSATKKLTWAGIKAALKGYFDTLFVPLTRKVNGKALAADITLSAADVGAAAASHGTHVTYSTAAPLVDGTAAAGTAATVARSDHRHPTDTGRAAASHTHAASQVTAGTLGGQVLANAAAQATAGTAQLRNIYAGTGAMTAGTTALTNGVIYCQYE